MSQLCPRTMYNQPLHCYNKIRNQQCVICIPSYPSDRSSPRMLSISHSILSYKLCFIAVHICLLSILREFLFLMMLMVVCCPSDSILILVRWPLVVIGLDMRRIPLAAYLLTRIPLSAYPLRRIPLAVWRTRCVATKWWIKKDR